MARRAPMLERLQVERIGHNRAFVVALHHVQERLPVAGTENATYFPSGEIAGRQDSRSRTTPQTPCPSRGGLPDTLARAGRRNIQR